MENLKAPQVEFKLKQFENVKSRLFELPRPTPNRSASVPCGRRAACSPTEDEEVDRSDDRGADDGNDDKEEEMDMASFELEVERLKKQHGRKESAPPKFQKDSAGCPAYLQKMKADRVEQQHQAEIQRNAPQIPSGYRQMPENERVETVEALQKKREELEKAFQRLPFVIETDNQRRRQKTILDKIEETDKAIKTFSNPLVLVEA